MSTEEEIGIKCVDGRYILEGAVIEDQEYDDFCIGPPDNPGDYLVRDCQFHNCRVSGPLCIWMGVAVRNVVFDSMLSSDLFTILTPIVLERVVFTGRGKGLWVKPYYSPSGDAVPAEYNLWAKNESLSVSVMLDVRDYCDYVEVLGLPLDKVLINPEKHVAIKRIWNNHGGWKQLGIPESTVWATALSGLDTHDCETGVYSLPKHGTRRFDQALKELDLLRASGVA